MTALEQLAELLGTDATDNYWSNDLVVTARDLVGQLSGADWTVLEQGWRGHPPLWQQRLAEVLSRGRPGHTLPILVPMIESDDDELSLAAADSLSEVAPEVNASALTTRADARLAALAGKSKLNGRVIRNLLDRLIRERG